MGDVQILLKFVKQNLDDRLKTKALGDEYYYQSLTLAAIDAVFSAQARYPSVKSVIQRYCNKYKLPVIRNSKECLPALEGQESITSLIQKMKQVGLSYFVENVFVNQSKTSGRLKTEILLDLLKEIQSLNIESFQDIQPWLAQPDKQREFLGKITEIRGIGEATSRYFLMLSGDNQMVKPDTMILRFIENALGRKVHAIESVSLIQEVSRLLLPEYPHMNPRLLDHLIWSWQRSQSNSKNFIFPHQKGNKTRKDKQKQNIEIQTSSREKDMTIPQKTQQSMHMRYQPGKVLSSAQIKNDVLTDYPDTPRDSVMPLDYCCNKWNLDPSSGIYHIFYYEKSDKKYRLLPKMDITKPRQRGVCV